MRKDTLFRGCTRPAMFLGVPQMPFFIGAGFWLIAAMYLNMLFLIGIPPTIFVMRQMARRDEMIFRLLGLRLQFRLRTRNIAAHGGIWAFTPNAYRDTSRRVS
ncbi:type IV secretion system protein VirB3 [Luteibacter sp. Sphag1AF]|uniref:type IV secretion system protein VirB3 n=1 Tax=Luteibacter sp. Sphag1AF TaxID=2587031 RepID=UPI00160E00B9|nr:VirB3 family type IV secretion system protein [Luteibacter sp. Sphag1AF]MBB3228348.1 type IV secretion system protein VirB3 [Luteibacter sp. Sphag1AF]